ncbi:hypothetical protein MKW92_014043 [Papaver armeniacum]|nr:hypothetical protein MKW92_014043 [Papaver armeniacum]
MKKDLQCETDELLHFYLGLMLVIFTLLLPLVIFSQRKDWWERVSINDPKDVKSEPDWNDEEEGIWRAP